MQLTIQVCILTRLKISIWYCYISEFFHVICIILQHVSYKCIGHIYVTSGLLSGSSGSTSMAHFNPVSNTHFCMRIYAAIVIKIVSYTKIACYSYSKDSQIIEVL